MAGMEANNVAAERNFTAIMIMPIVVQGRQAPKKEGHVSDVKARHSKVEKGDNSRFQ